MQVAEDDSYFSYLPLAHIFDQVIGNYCISKGASIGFWQAVWAAQWRMNNSVDSLLWPSGRWHKPLFYQDIRYLMEDVQMMKPTVFCGVPRVYDRIYTGKMHKKSQIIVSIATTFCD